MDRLDSLFFQFVFSAGEEEGDAQSRQGQKQPVQQMVKSSMHPNRDVLHGCSAIVTCTPAWVVE